VHLGAKSLCLVSNSNSIAYVQCWFFLVCTKPNAKEFLASHWSAPKQNRNEPIQPIWNLTSEWGRNDNDGFYFGLSVNFLDVPEKSDEVCDTLFQFWSNLQIHGVFTHNLQLLCHHWWCQPRIRLWARRQSMSVISQTRVIACMGFNWIGSEVSGLKKRSQPPNNNNGCHQHHAGGYELILVVDSHIDLFFVARRQQKQNINIIAIYWSCTRLQE